MNGSSGIVSGKIKTASGEAKQVPFTPTTLIDDWLQHNGLGTRREQTIHQFECGTEYHAAKRILGLLFDEAAWAELEDRYYDCQPEPDDHAD